MTAWEIETARGLRIEIMYDVGQFVTLIGIYTEVVPV